MANPKTYRLSQRSPVGNTGFELFKAKDDGLYYFHFNDDEGQAVLFSQGYASAKTRTAACDALRKRMAVKSSYVKKSENGLYYFVVVNKDREELARSKAFETKGSRDLLAEKLRQGGIPEGGVDKKADLSPQKSTDPGREKKSQSQAPAKGQSAQPARYRFNITFRKVADKTPLSGEIQFPISEERSTFQGFDVDAVRQFITQHLPGDTVAFSKEREKEIDAIKTELHQAMKAEQEKAAKQQAALKQQFQARISELKAALEVAHSRIKALEKEIQAAPAKATPPVKEESSSASTMANNQQALQLQQLLAKEQSKIKKPIELIINGQITDTLNLPKGKLPIELLLKIDQPKEQQALGFYRAIFQIKSMESGHIQQAIKFSGKLDQQNRILVSGNSLNGCDPGLYRLIIRAFPSDPTVPDCEIEGKRVVFTFLP